MVVSHIPQITKAFCIHQSVFFPIRSLSMTGHLFIKSSNSQQPIYKFLCFYIPGIISIPSFLKLTLNYMGLQPRDTQTHVQMYSNFSPSLKGLDKQFLQQYQLFQVVSVEEIRLKNYNLSVRLIKQKCFQIPLLILVIYISLQCLVNFLYSNWKVTQVLNRFLALYLMYFLELWQQSFPNFSSKEFSAMDSHRKQTKGFV